MVLHEFFVIHQGGIFAKLLSGFAVSIQELIEVREFFAVVRDRDRPHGDHNGIPRA